METKSSQKNSHKIYKCEYCDYLSYKIGNFNKHLTTPKHLRKQEETNLATFTDNFGNVNKSGEIKPATFFNTIKYNGLYIVEDLNRTNLTKIKRGYSSHKIILLNLYNIICYLGLL